MGTLNPDTIIAGGRLIEPNVDTSIRADVANLMIVSSPVIDYLGYENNFDKVGSIGGAVNTLGENVLNLSENGSLTSREWVGTAEAILTLSQLHPARQSIQKLKRAGELTAAGVSFFLPSAPSEKGAEPTPNHEARDRFEREHHARENARRVKEAEQRREKEARDKENQDFKNNYEKNNPNSKVEEVGYNPYSGNPIYRVELPDGRVVYTDNRMSSKLGKQKDEPQTVDTPNTPDWKDDVNPNNWRDKPNRQGKHYFYDPIVLDLDGDGIETLAHNKTKGAIFDFDADGLKHATGWVKSDDGILVFDRNADGFINDGREVFGDSTLKADGSLAKHGFDALTDLDTNADGYINQDDDAYKLLKVWQDKNQDGISQADELKTLEELNIQSLNLSYQNTKQNLNGGNELAQIGNYTKTDGTTFKMGDVNFKFDSLYSKHSLAVDITDVQIPFLPNLAGGGRVRSLHEAMQLSAELKDIVIQYAQATTKQAQLELLPSLLKAWAKTDPEYQELRIPDLLESVQSFDGTGVAIAGSPRPVTLSAENAEKIREQYKAIAYKIGVIDSFLGTKTENLYYHSEQNAKETINLINKTYDDLSTAIYSGLYGQGGVFNHYNQYVQLHISFDDEQNIQYKLNFEPLIQHLQQKIATGDEQQLKTIFVDLVEYINHFQKQKVLQQYDIKDVLILFAQVNENMSMEQQTAWLNDVNPHLLKQSLIKFGTDRQDYITDRFVVAQDGNDYIYGTQQASILLGGKGYDRIQGYQGNDYLDGGDGYDGLYGGNGNDTLIGGLGNDYLNGEQDDDYINGGLGNDTLNGGDGHDKLFGGEGDDILSGQNGNDMLIGGLGNDILNGGTEADTYIFSKGHGQDVVDDNNTNSTDVNLSQNKLVLTDVRLDEVKFISKDKDLILTGYNSDDSITIQNFNSYQKLAIEQFQFADITVSLQDLFGLKMVYWQQTEYSYLYSPAWLGKIGRELSDKDDRFSVDRETKITYIDGGKGNDHIYMGSSTKAIELLGGEGHDTLYGGYGNDTLIGGTGNDYLDGGKGADTYIFSKGHGQDMISDDDINHNDGQRPQDKIIFTDIRSDEIQIELKGDDLIIKGYHEQDQIKLTNFKRNEKYHIEQFQFADKTVSLSELFGEYKILGTEYNDNFMFHHDWALPLMIDGMDGDDTIYGTIANNTLIGGEGHDNLSGQNGDDHLNGGEGDDRLYGGYGHDTLIGDNGDDYLYGADENDVLIGGVGTDELVGGYGSDTYIFSKGHGQDVITEDMRTYFFEQPDVDKIVFTDVHSDDIQIILSDNHLIMTGYHQNDRVVIKNYRSHFENKVEHIEFSNASYNLYDFLVLKGLGEYIYTPPSRYSSADYGMSKILESMPMPLSSDDILPVESVSTEPTLALTVEIPSELDLVNIEFSPEPDGLVLPEPDMSSFVVLPELDMLIYPYTSSFDPFAIYRAGSKQDDNLYGSSGNDTLIGSLGNDILVGHQGADTAVLRKQDLTYHHVDYFIDFNLKQGDKLDIRDLLEQPNQTIDLSNLNDYFSTEKTNDGMVLKFDQDGHQQDQHQSQAIMRFQSNAFDSLDQLIQANSFIL